ncbi:MAG: LamG domain-containing protein [Pseudomonadota bacterium]
MADLNDGLVAYYPFNGNANDESGNGNNGVVHGATLTEDRFGSADSAYNFDGINNYIEFSDDPSLNFGSDEFTISFWVKPNSLHDYQRFLTKYNQVGGWIIYGNSNGRLYINFSREKLLSLEIGTYEANSWQLFTIVRTPTNIIFYKNNNLLSSQDIVTGNVDINEELFIGTCGSGCNVANKIFNGFMDEVRLYNRALSESEIQQLYQPCQPSIDIKLNSNNRVTGDRVVINAHIKGSGGSDSSCEQTKVEQKVWVKLPNDAVIPLIEPFTGLTLLPGDDIDTKIFEYTFSGAEPIGAYQIGGRLLHPFSGDTISTDIEVLTFSQ